MESINLIGINKTLYKEVLDNGLEIYLFPNNKVNNFYINLNVKYGSLYTSFKSNNKNITVPNGVAHFLEHLTFKMDDGTDASEFYAKMGSYSNAYTSYDVTCYEVLAYNNFKENLEYLIKFITTPSYNKKIVNDEKGIICEEVKMYEDEPSYNLGLELNKSLFVNSNYRYPIGGSVEEVKSITLNDINNCYNSFYRPNNMFIVITGNFNYKEAVTIIKNYFKNKEYGKDKISINKPKEIDKVVCEYKEIPSKIEKEKIAYGIKIPLKKFDNLNISKEELKIYIDIILSCNFGKTSKLCEDLISSNIINDNISIQDYFIDDYIIINLFSDINYKDEYINKINEQFNNLILDEDDIIRKKRVKISDYIIGSTSIEDMSSFINSNILNYNKVINNIYDLYVNIDYKKSNKILKLLDNKNKSIVVLVKE